MTQSFVISVVKSFICVRKRTQTGCFGGERALDFPCCGRGQSSKAKHARPVATSPPCSWPVTSSSDRGVTDDAGTPPIRLVGSRIQGGKIMFYLFARQKASSGNIGES